MRSLFFFLPLFALNYSLQAQEPAYCQPQKFLSQEYKSHDGLWRSHAFKFGDVVLVGAAVGYSITPQIVRFVKNNSNADSAEKYCTWYFNEGNDYASKIFNHNYVHNPKEHTTTSGPLEYSSVLKDQFAQAPTSFLSCLEKNKILVMGCNGQMHRGPTVFGMLLAFSGCSPQNSATIVNGLWGYNGVKPEVRLAIINEAYQMGSTDLISRWRMQKALGY